jgi:hypothetical protein
MAQFTLIFTALAAVFAILGIARAIAVMLRELKWRKYRTGKWLLLLALCLLPSWAEAAGNEARCDELGANCICSEPMNTSTWTDALNSIWFNPSDTTTKQCSSSGVVAGGFLEDGSGFTDYSGVSSGEQITNLPAAHTNTYVLKIADGQGGTAAGHRFSGGDPTARRAIRFYKYYSSSPAYDWVGGACLNSNKIAQGGWNGALTGGPMFTETAGTWSFYDINTAYGHNESVDCCDGPGPGESATGPALSTLRGKWIRYEAVFTNLTTSGASSFQWYMKNVTDNTAEIRLVDTTQSNGTGVGKWSTSNASNFGYTTVMDELSINMFRNGTCAGSASFSHYLAAAWSTDAGQRIGAATEIEGGGGFVPTITMFIEAAPIAVSALWHFRQAVLSGLMAVWLVSGAVLSFATQKTKQVTYQTTLVSVQTASKLLAKVKSWP